jgi:asparagine synthase (glutamine-hydrolysing)
MCGITGFFGVGDRADLLSMTAALVHRGPDEQGLYVNDSARVFLGHRRLAILDIDGGHQPMFNEDGCVAVIFNGEVYNHAEIRAELQARGHVFRSHHSDTEVLVHGYEEWGAGLPERLNGMFAFAIYDSVRRRFFLARDRFGEKPLYYLHRRDLFAFASELTALTCHSGFEARPSLQALQKLFAYGYIPAPHALFEGSFKLPAGHHLTLHLADNSIIVAPYWRFRIEADKGLPDSAEPALIDELEHLLSQAVRRRLISDVPLGVFLSGGIDSSAVLAMGAQHRPAGSIKSFTIGFTEPSFDESRYARHMAAAVGSAHQEQLLDLDIARGLLPSVLRRLDEPLADSSILPTYLLSHFTRQQVTVALSGDGGDELFAGYDPFTALASARVYSAAVPRALHKGLRRLVELLPISTRNMSLDFKLRRALAGLSYPAAGWNPVWMAPLEPQHIAELLNSSARFEELYQEAIALWDGSQGKDDVDRTLEFFTIFYLQDDILMKVDRAAMMVSLESRAVFLDNDLVAFCQRLPNRFKIRNGERKYILKKMLARHLPPEILSRRKKGFGIPLAKWLRSMPSMQQAVIAGMNSAVIQRWWDEHRLARADHRFALFTNLSLQYVGRQPRLGPHSVLTGRLA